MTQNLQDAFSRLDGASGELSVDCSAQRRVDGADLAALEKLATAADKRTVKVALTGVSVEVYKVLKLVKLDRRFTFPA